MGFWVAPVGMPPHFLKRFQISTLYAAVCSSFSKKVELVHVVASCLVLGAVDGNSVPHLILHNQHTELLELLAEFADVIADEAVVDIHIRSVIEDVQRAVNIDFKGGCDALCLRLLLIPQNVVEVFEDWHFLRLGSARNS